MPTAAKFRRFLRHVFLKWRVVKESRLCTEELHRETGSVQLLTKNISKIRHKFLQKHYVMVCLNFYYKNISLKREFPKIFETFFLENYSEGCLKKQTWGIYVWFEVFAVMIWCYSGFWHRVHSSLDASVSEKHIGFIFRAKVAVPAASQYFCPKRCHQLPIVHISKPGTSSSGT
jgi:hypothetical protein